MRTNGKQSNFRKFLLLWFGELISAIGGGLTSFGLSVYVFQQTGSAAGMALVALLGFLPTLLLSVPAGVLADRYDRRLLMMLGDGCSALGVLAIWLGMLRGNASLAVICIGVFISAVFSALLEPAYKATVSDLLTKEEFTKARGLVSLAGSVRYLICVFGFLFFAMPPLANSSLDYLVRTNIPDALQGRAWGFIGLISQLGYVVAYGFGGLLADAAGNLLQKGVGRGAALVIILSGVCLLATAIWMGRVQSIQALEPRRDEKKQKMPMRKDWFQNASFTAFVAVVILMISLTMLLFVSLTSAIDALMNAAKTPDFLQMHSGKMDTEEWERFTHSREEVADAQIAGFLNLDNGILWLGGQPLLDSTQDNDLCVQGERFDYLLGMDNSLPEVLPGQVYVPICYQSLYAVQVGDVMKIGAESLRIAGFIRDAQMNSMMASSKRFLVCAKDYDRLRSLGSEELLIEYRLKSGADSNAFQTAYENAGLPMNGPTITKPLMKLMNVLSDGDTLSVKQGSAYAPFRITDINSDITNGGKTAKMFSRRLNTQENVMWNIVYLSLRDDVDREAFLARYQANGAEAIDIASQVMSVYGPTLKQLRMAALLIKAIAAVIILLVIGLFVRLLIANDRNRISIQKALGLAGAEIKRSYRNGCAPYLAAGIVLGAMLGNTLGEKICGLALQALGAAEFAFTLNGWSVLSSMAVGGVASILAFELAAREIRSIKAVECCRGRE